MSSPAVTTGVHAGLDHNSTVVVTVVSLLICGLVYAPCKPLSTYLDASRNAIIEIDEGGVKWKGNQAQTRKYLNLRKDADYKNTTYTSMHEADHLASQGKDISGSKKPKPKTWLQWLQGMQWGSKDPNPLLPTTTSPTGSTTSTSAALARENPLGHGR
ncbi:uncharacterized protein APUU_20121S [Aspergillus puulaauensis]|uniref:Uncharacterized protein n=1 Tax=Aspergillus puulaauensis TaxID=1220207 RepID=A0A7R8AHJ7_9EURO|nr:uncharacterized protein APUU_20121S [Aspergillus puulaauensis]BCS19689.1 hypothetical protein APUU_20121S [Aspergillus puulaauensis]